MQTDPSFAPFITRNCYPKTMKPWKKIRTIEKFIIISWAEDAPWGRTTSWPRSTSWESRLGKEMFFFFFLMRFHCTKTNNLTFCWWILKMEKAWREKNSCCCIRGPGLRENFGGRYPQKRGGSFRFNYDANRLQLCQAEEYPPDVCAKILNIKLCFLLI